MNEESNSKKKLVQDYIEHVINTGQIQNITEFISQDYTEEYNGQRYVLGISGAIKHVEGVRETYPDLKLKIEKQICEGNWVATYYIMNGTHQGEWMNIKPTNEKIMIYGINLDKVINNKIVEHCGAANLLEPLIKSGAIQIVKK
ncbi:ester cyclase [Mangrovivirga sp. M17]|uniref:Ester cyclase n=1 Tax=Mangrovivirga halotolerans TaxID=2993936 RepID=A0ABT3RVD0_9BACT|nr:ester cyclase [Mangrovivirga halotolerans]MCX2745590.1 ester cyclase [Mangrovivirga halotolerans]